MNNSPRSRTDLVYYKLFRDSPTKGEKMRLRIIEEALKCLTEEGIHEMTLERLGKRLKIPRQHVSYYFSTLDELLDAIFTYITYGGQDETVAKLTENLHPDWRKLLRTYLHATFTWCHEHPEQVTSLWLFYYYSTQKLPYGELMARVRETSKNRIREIIRAAFAEHRQREIDLNALAETIFALIVGKALFFTTAVFQTKKTSLSKTEKETESAVITLIEQALTTNG